MVLMHSHYKSTQLNRNKYEVVTNNPLNANEKEMTESEKAKQLAAFACAEENIRSGMLVGVGSGSTIKYLILWLKQKCDEGSLTDIKCVPTSFQTRQWLHEAGLQCYSPETLNSLDLTIDGADEIDFNLTCIKGGGGCLLQEKIIQSCTNNFILVAHSEKYVEYLGTKHKSIPIEVVQIAWAPVRRWIIEKLGGECILRMDLRKCFPSVTENHNYIFDWHFPDDPKRDWKSVEQTLINITGVVETGIFFGVAKKAYVADLDGKITTYLPK